MKVSEILRQFADKLDQVENGQSGASETNAKLTPVAVDNTDHTEPGEKMIPPLQQKIELLKKAAGVDSEFDDTDEMQIMKRNAGIAPVVLQIASDDEPLDM